MRIGVPGILAKPPAEATTGPKLQEPNETKVRVAFTESFIVYDEHGNPFAYDLEDGSRVELDRNLTED